jgi:hypothetical protein
MNYRRLLKDKFGYPKEVTTAMTDEECKKMFDKETLALLGDFIES